MAVFFVLCSSCDRNESQRAIVTIKKGEFSYPIRLLMLDTIGIRAIDSLTKLVKGDIEFRIKLKEAGIYILQANGWETEFIASVGDTIMFEPLNKSGFRMINGNEDGDSIMLEVGDKRLIPVQSTTNVNYQSYINKLQGLEQQADSLSNVFILSQSTDTFALVRENVNKAFNRLKDEAKSTSAHFILNNSSSIGIFRAINSSIKQTPVFNYAIDHELFLKTDSLLQANHPGNKYSVWMHNKIALYKQTAGGMKQGAGKLIEGTLFPKVELPGLRNNTVTLQPSKASITLVYLWDNSTRSRQTNLKIKQLSEAYQNKSFNLFTIAFDNNPKRWASTIVLDKMWGSNAIDTLANRSGLLRDLGIKQLPSFILIDSNSKVLGYFSNTVLLEEYLKHYFEAKN